MIGWADVRREPFRLFFPLGVIFGLLGVNHWLVYALGWSSSYSGFYHASIQVSSFMSCFIVGFLLTALPRLASTNPASTPELGVILLLLLAQPLGLSSGHWVAAEVCFAGLLVAVAVFAGRRFSRRRTEVRPPTEFVWIPIAFLHGIVGSVLVVCGQLTQGPPWVLAMGRPMVQQGFLLSIVMGVGGFLASRLLGRGVLPVSLSASEARRIRRRRITLHAIAGLLLFVSFALEGSGAIRVAYGLRAAIVSTELIWTTQPHRLPKVADLHVRFIWVALWLILLGLWGSALRPVERVLMLHVTFLGGFSVMVFAVATMVVLSHSGEGSRLRQPLWVLRVVGIGIAGAVVARVAAEGWPQHFFPLLGIAAASWSLAGLGWLAFALPYVIRPVPAGEFERIHEEAKRQLLKTAASSPSC